MPTSLPRRTPSIDLEEINSHWPREAKRINDEIDAQIEVEKSERRKRRPDIRIILLGTIL